LNFTASNCKWRKIIKIEGWERRFNLRRSTFQFSNDDYAREMVFIHQIFLTHKALNQRPDYAARKFVY